MTREGLLAHGGAGGAPGAAERFMEQWEQLSKEEAWVEVGAALVLSPLHCYTVTKGNPAPGSFLWFSHKVLYLYQYSYRTHCHWTSLSLCHCVPASLYDCVTVQEGLEQWLSVAGGGERVGAGARPGPGERDEPAPRVRPLPRVPCALECPPEAPRFPVSLWVARLELLVSPSALVVTHLQRSLRQIRRTVSAKMMGMQILEEGNSMENAGKTEEGARGGEGGEWGEGAELGGCEGGGMAGERGGEGGETPPRLGGALLRGASECEGGSSMMWARKKLLRREGPPQVCHAQYCTAYVHRQKVCHNQCTFLF